MFAALLGPALSFGSSLISGLGARQSAKKQAKIQAAYEYQNYLLQQQDNERNTALTQWKNEQNYMLGGEVLARWDRNKLVQDADRMGFNPVTYANAFGPSYAAMEQFGWQLRSPEILLTNSYMQNAPTTQVPSVTEAVGGAVQAGVNTYLSDRRVAQSQDFQREILATQIAAIQRNGGRPTSAMNVPAAQRTFFGSGQIPYVVTAGPVGQSGKSAGIIGFSPWEPGKVDVTDPFYSRLGVAPVADAGVWTQRYGESELVEMAVAAKTGLDDVTWKNYRNTAQTFFGNKYYDMFGYPEYPDRASRAGAGVTDDMADFWSWSPARNWRAATRNVPWSLPTNPGPLENYGYASPAW